VIAELESFSEAVRGRNPMHHRYVATSLAALLAPEAAQLAEYLKFCLAQGLSFEDVAKAYLVVVNDTMREQMYFRKHGTYRASKFADVAGSVYFNAPYMESYMYGLAISSFLWPNHLEIFRFFRRSIPRDRAGDYLEIGPGHGYFMRTAIGSSSYENFMGVDISATSISQTQRLLDHFDPGSTARIELREMDFLESDLAADAYSAVVMGEVLEHVEQPDLFLREVVRVAKDDAFIFVTTCINAPAIDHIYLFDSPEQVQRIIADCGLRIESEAIMPYEGTTLRQSLDQRLAINVGYVLAKS
jgi:2-polyprenyl-3-methyl-5-hydroxy-6-metoxy-1,4-benzoquinol methylase